MYKKLYFTGSYCIFTCFIHPQILAALVGCNLKNYTIAMLVADYISGWLGFIRALLKHEQIWPPKIWTISTTSLAQGGNTNFPSHFQVDGVGAPLICTGELGLTGIASQTMALNRTNSSSQMVYLFTDIFQYNVWITSTLSSTSTSPFPNISIIFLVAILVTYFNNNNKIQEPILCA